MSMKNETMVYQFEFRWELRISGGLWAIVMKWTYTNKLEPGPWRDGRVNL